MSKQIHNGESGFGESGRHQPLTLISANRVSAKRVSAKRVSANQVSADRKDTLWLNGAS